MLSPTQAGSFRDLSSTSPVKSEQLGVVHFSPLLMTVEGYYEVGPILKSSRISSSLIKGKASTVRWNHWPPTREDARMGSGCCIWTCDQGRLCLHLVAMLRLPDFVIPEAERM